LLAEKNEVRCAGVSLISASFARNEFRAGELKLIPIADIELWRELEHF
jgi:hypothetical protein